MAVKAPPLVLAWGSVFFLSVAWFLLLGGVGSLQSVSSARGRMPMHGASAAVGPHSHRLPIGRQTPPPAGMRRLWCHQSPACRIGGIPVSVRVVRVLPLGGVKGGG